MSRKDIVRLDFFDVVTFYKKTTEFAALMKNHYSYQSKILKSFQAQERPTVACRPLDCLNYWFAALDSTERTLKTTKKGIQRRPKKEVLYE